MIKWETKYRPKSLKEIIGHKKEIKIIKKWMVDFINEIPKCKKVLLITGNSGIGKTILANSLLNDYGYRIVEHMCDDIKGSKNIEKIIKRSLVYNNILDCFNNTSKPIGLILDQINILSDGGANKNGLNDLINILKMDIDNYKKNKKNTDYIYIYNPIICVCQRLDSKIKKLLKYSIHVNLDDFNVKDIQLKIKPILKKENVKITTSAINKIIDYSNKDYRRFINLLEELHEQYSPKKINVSNVYKLKNIISHKNKRYLLNETINELMTKKMKIPESMELFNNNHFMTPFYMYDTYLLYLNNYEENDKKKIKVYSELLENSCLYEYNNNQLDNKYDTNYIFNSHYVSSVPNYLCSNIKLKKKYINNDLILNKIEFPKLYTYNASRFINKKYINFNFYNIYLINLIHYHLFNKKGNNKKLLKYLKNNIKDDDIDKLVKYKKVHLSFKPQIINKITKVIKNKYLILNN